MCVDEHLPGVEVANCPISSQDALRERRGAGEDWDQDDGEDDADADGSDDLVCFDANCYVDESMDDFVCFDPRSAVP